MGQRRRADQCQIHRQTGFCRLLPHVQRHMVHADGVGGGVKGHTLPTDSQQGQKVRLINGLPPGRIFLGDQTVFQFLRGQMAHIRQGIIETALRLLRQKLCQHRHIKADGLTHRSGHGCPRRIGEQTVGKLGIALLQPALGRLRRQAFQHRTAQLHHVAAADPSLGSVALQSGGKVRLPQQLLHGLLRKTDAAAGMGNEVFTDFPDTGRQMCVHKKRPPYFSDSIIVLFFNA